MVFTGPVTHYMYQLLEQAVSTRSQYSSIKKVIIDRLLFAPPYLLALFYSVAIMEVSTEAKVHHKGCHHHYGKGALSCRAVVSYQQTIVHN